MRFFGLVLLTGLISNIAFGMEDGFLSCATSDRTVQLSASEQIHFSVKRPHMVTKAMYEEGDQSRILYFTNGETVVREVATGRTVLSFKEIPLSRQDRGFEKKILVSKADRLTAPEVLQCRFISTKTKLAKDTAIAKNEAASASTRANAKSGTVVAQKPRQRI